MKKSRFTDSQILAFLKEAGVKVLGLCRKHGMSDAKQCPNSPILGLTDHFKRAERALQSRYFRASGLIRAWLRVCCQSPLIAGDPLVFLCSTGGVGRRDCMRSGLHGNAMFSPSCDCAQAL